MKVNMTLVTPSTCVGDGDFRFGALSLADKGVDPRPALVASGRPRPARRDHAARAGPRGMWPPWRIGSRYPSPLRENRDALARRPPRGRPGRRMRWILSAPHRRLSSDS